VEAFFDCLQPLDILVSKVGRKEPLVSGRDLAELDNLLSAAGLLNRVFEADGKAHGALRQALDEAPALLAAGGRLGVISFHSGEDRIVKRTFRALESAGFAELEPSPLGPEDDEVRANPRARSAKLRVLERLS